MRNFVVSIRDMYDPEATMTQDTRKDPRAKVLTMTVRYKSASVEEFIENHAHDVSRGGIFIKTGQPFPEGTLLKFEIKIANETSVIQGVGRVVWKREAAQSSDESPSGMGVKFIKIDDRSKSVIDRIVNSKPEGTPSAYDAEAGAEAARPAPATGGVAAAAPRKGTMLGLGTEAIKAAVTQTQTKSEGDGMFGKAASAKPLDEPPPQERTVMKQAAELLQEALKEAGGSLDEVGSGPLFTPEPAAADSKKPEPTPAPEPVEEEPADAEDEPEPEPEPAPPPKKEEPVAVAATETPAPAKAAEPAKKVRSIPPPEPAPAEGGSGKGLLIVGVIVAAGLAVYFGFFNKPDIAPPPPPQPTATVTASAPASAEPPATASAAEPATPEPSASASASASATASASASASASAPTPGATAPAPTTAAPPKEPAPTATAPKEPAPKPTTAPAPKPPKPADPYE